MVGPCSNSLSMKENYISTDFVFPWGHTLVNFVPFCVRFSRASLKMALRENGGHNPKSTGKNPKVSLIHSDELIKLCDKLPKVPNRVSSLSYCFRFFIISSIDASINALSVVLTLLSHDHLILTGNVDTFAY